MCCTQWSRARMVEGCARGCHHMHVRVDGRGRYTVTCCRALSGCCSPDHVEDGLRRVHLAMEPLRQVVPHCAQWVLPQYRVPSGYCRSTEYRAGTAAVPSTQRVLPQYRVPSVYCRSTQYPAGTAAVPITQWVLPQYRVPSGYCRSTQYPAGTAAVLVAQPFGLRRKLQRRFPSVNRRSDSMHSAAQRAVQCAAQRSAIQVEAHCNAAQRNTVQFVAGAAPDVAGGTAAGHARNRVRNRTLRWSVRRARRLITAQLPQWHCGLSASHAAHTALRDAKPMEWRVMMDLFIAGSGCSWYDGTLCCRKRVGAHLAWLL
jgi:hypothetical protein